MAVNTPKMRQSAATVVGQFAVTTALVLLTFSSAAAARDLQGAVTEAAGSFGKTLPYGVTPCEVFGSSSKYNIKELSKVSEVLNRLLDWAGLLQTTWCGSGGGARYTILAPDNKAMTRALAQLHKEYGTTTHPERFTVVGPPLDYDEPLTNLWDAIWESHIIPFPVDFYHNATVLKATKAHPLKLPIGYGYVNSHIHVYHEKGVVYAHLPGNLVAGPVAIPKAKTIIGPFEKGDNSLIPIYTIDKLLVPPTLTRYPQQNNGHHSKTIKTSSLLRAVGSATTTGPP